MARRSFEMNFRIAGNVARSFNSSFRSAGSSLNMLSSRSRELGRSLSNLDADFRRGRINQAQYESAARRLRGELNRLALAQGAVNKAAGGFNAVRNVAGIAAIGTAAAATGLALKSVNKAAGFEAQMTKVGVIAGASSSEMERLRDTALDLGASSSLSATEVSIAMKELAAKGMDTNKIIGAMPGILDAAESSGEDLALTSNVVTSALNAFELKASDATHVADVMAMSANKTAAGVEDLGYSFKYAAPVAKTLGVSLEELAAATGLMVDKGLTGEQAGTSLRMALIRLAKPPKLAKKALDKLNLSVTDSKGNFKSIAQISEDWNKSTKKLTQSQKVQYAATVFGVEASTGMLNLFASGPKKIEGMTKALKNSTGTAKEAAKAMKDNYAGSLEQLKGSIESAQIRFATPILPEFQKIFDGITSTIDKNMGGIENAGKRVAAGLSDIFEPFSMQKPVKPKTPKIVGGPQVLDLNGKSAYSLEMEQYQKELEKYNMFGKMDFGDKVVYMLEETSEKVSTWVSGSGGENMNQIFTSLGEIAAKSWIAAFKGAVKSAGSNLVDGNFATALGMGTVAWMMGGGALVRGGMALGRGARGLATRTPTVPPVSPVPPAVPPTPPGTPETRTSRLAGASRTSRGLSAVGKVASKVALPLAVASEAYNVYKAEDKTKAAVSGVSGIAAGLGGAKIGAAIGTAILPGIGTAVGGALGGLGGFLTGKWLGKKAVDTTRQVAGPAPVSTSQSGAAIQQTNETLTAANAKLGQESTKLLSSFTSIKTSADLLKGNLDILTMYTGQASGWLASLNGIKTAGDRVIAALNNLEQRINNIELPNGKSKRVGYN